MEWHRKPWCVEEGNSERKEAGEERREQPDS
jgi:hypothetical protein